ncbi:MAG TPA: DUF4178 domain-containing protein [Bryobacteraceae bacterium]|nr:DUF4178 domain-containing protein [Bryobacteraceae bacterium]
MSAPAGNCPNCGAPIAFRWSSAIQTTCEFCHSILVRTDVDLKKVGEVADLPADASPIQIGTEGVYQNKGFVVIGRIMYEYEQGGWNEWHVVYNDNSNGWLSDAQLEYDLSWLAKPPQPIPLTPTVQPGARFNWNDKNYEATSVTKARYKGVQGELPFEYWDKADVLFADLRTTTGDFATIDYSENPPLLFLGRAVDFDDLHFKNLRLFEGWTS